jgi:cytochrome c
MAVRVAQTHLGMRQMLLLLAVCLFSWGPSAWADVSVGRALAAQRQCLGCHQVNARRVGPPFAAIAQRFQGRADAAPYLAQQIRQGSRGQWGAIPMPAQTRVSKTDAIQLARWILSLANTAPH